MEQTASEGGAQDSTISLARQIVEMKPLLRDSLTFSIMSCLTILALILYVYLGNNEIALLVVATLIMCCIILAISYSFSLPKAYRSIKTLDKWVEKYYAYSHLTALEFVERDKSLTVVEDVARRVNDIHPGLPRKAISAPRLLGIDRTRSALEFDAIKVGRTGEHRFDAILHRQGNKHMFIRLFDPKGGEVTAEDLRSYSHEVEDALRKGRGALVVKYALSEKGFSQDAIKLAEDDGRTLLLKVEAEQYKIIVSPYAP